MAAGQVRVGRLGPDTDEWVPGVRDRRGRDVDQPGDPLRAAGVDQAAGPLDVRADEFRPPSDDVDLRSEVQDRVLSPGGPAYDVGVGDVAELLPAVETGRSALQDRRPSSRAKRTRRPRPRNSTQRSWARSSFSVK